MDVFISSLVSNPRTISSLGQALGMIWIIGFDTRYAVAGGNVCAVAKERGIKGFIIDGVIRDLGEIQSMQFPVYAQGVFPVPGAKSVFTELAQPITCGDVKVNTGDMIVADIEGIAVLPKASMVSIYEKAFLTAEQEAQLGLDKWRDNHQAKIKEAYSNKESLVLEI